MTLADAIHSYQVGKPGQFFAVDLQNNKVRIETKRQESVDRVFSKFEKLMTDEAKREDLSVDELKKFRKIVDEKHADWAKSLNCVVRLVRFIFKLCFKPQTDRAYNSLVGVLAKVEAKKAAEPDVPTASATDKPEPIKTPPRSSPPTTLPTAPPTKKDPKPSETTSSSTDTKVATTGGPNDSDPIKTDPSEKKDESETTAPVTGGGKTDDSPKADPPPTATASDDNGEDTDPFKADPPPTATASDDIGDDVTAMPSKKHSGTSLLRSMTSRLLPGPEKDYRGIIAEYLNGEKEKGEYDAAFQAMEAKGGMEDRAHEILKGKANDWVKEQFKSNKTVAEIQQDKRLATILTADEIEALPALENGRLHRAEEALKALRKDEKNDKTSFDMQTLLEFGVMEELLGMKAMKHYADKGYMKKVWEANAKVLAGAVQKSEKERFVGSDQGFADFFISKAGVVAASDEGGFLHVRLYGTKSAKKDEFKNSLRLTIRSGDADIITDNVRVALSLQQSLIFLKKRKF